MVHQITFENNVSNHFDWNNIDFNLNTAIKNMVLSEKNNDTYIIHINYVQNGDTWQGYKCLVSFYQNDNAIITIYDDPNWIMPMLQYCAVYYSHECRYRPPLNGRYANHFPNAEFLYQIKSQEQFDDFNKSYFLDKI